MTCLERVLTWLAVQSCSDADRAAAAVDLKNEDARKLWILSAVIAHVCEKLGAVNALKEDTQFMSNGYTRDSCV